MSELEKNVKNDNLLNNGKPSSLDEIFEKRENRHSENKNVKVTEGNKVDEKPLEQKDQKNEDKTDDEKANKVKDNVKKTSPLEEEDDDHKNSELESIKKSLNDSRKWGHDNNRRLKSALKMLETLKEKESFTEDDFTKLNSLLTSDTAPDSAEDVNTSNDPFINLMNIANTRLDDLREIYENDEFFDHKVRAFLSAIENSSKEEISDILDEMEEIKKSPLKLAKKMYEIGDKFYKEVYESVETAGGLKAFILEKNAEVARLKKKIDSLEKKMSQSSEYDKPTFKIDELSGNVDKTTKHRPNDGIGQLFEERDSSYRRVKGY